MPSVIRSIILEVTITLAATGAAYGVVELLRWAMDLPAPAIPMLPLILAIITMTRLLTSGMIARLLGTK